MTINPIRCLALAVFLAGLPLSANAWQETVGFNRDIRPLLSDRCFHCHGPNEHDRQAGLRLDHAEGIAAVVEPGSPDDSELWNRLTAGENEVMPPADSHKPRLTPDELDQVRRWIEQGGQWEDFWAFVPVHRPKIPVVDNPAWNRSPIDALVYRQLQERGMSPSPRADRRTLLRRLSLDLTGLPPTPRQIRRFLSDREPAAWERAVDRMLDSPGYGEHMTRYWLDLVRFADTNGIHHDHFRNMSPYRDWVIRSFNQNLPWNEFVTWQLAGDLVPEPTQDQLVASGFNRLHMIIDVGTALPEESLHRNVVDRVTAVGTAFLGLTVQCAVCHDHKYDPLTARDFYALAGFFNNLDAQPETGHRRGDDFRRGLQAPYISLASPHQQSRLDEFTRQIGEWDSRIAALQQAAAGEDLPGTPATDGRKDPEVREDPEVKEDPELLAARAAREALLRQRTALEDAIDFAMVMKERAEPRPSYLLVRGEYDNPGEPVARNTPAFLPPLDPSGWPATRLDLANWLVRPDHPLLARVTVNRFWQQLFGRGLVRTSEDFGAQGQGPTHPELLDWLASELVESGWDVKRLMKQIVMSETWRQSSVAPADLIAADPDNRWLARGSRYRLDAEVIRDLILSSSGLLVREMYGRSVKPPQPPGLWRTVNMPGSFPNRYEPDPGDARYRRSLYTFWKRSMPPPQMTLLDAPTRESCIARRERTNTPLQALLLLNEAEYLKAAGRLAGQVLAVDNLDTAARIERAYEAVTGRLPDRQEQEALQQLLDRLQAEYQARPRLAAQLSGDGAPAGDVTRSELAAWTMLVSTLYNLDMTRTRY